MEIIKNAKMKEYSNMKVGGTAKELIFIDDKNELKEILQTRNNIFLLGNGTNTLINDGNLNISFLSLKRLKNITVELMGQRFLTALKKWKFVKMMEKL